MEMELADALQLVTVALTAGSMLATAVWVVGRVRSETRELRASLDHLNATMVRLDVRTVAAVERLDRRLDHHGERLARLEATTSDPSLPAWPPPAGPTAPRTE